MITNELLAYIRAQRRNGGLDQKIKNTLAENGWPLSEVEEAFEQVNQPHTPTISSDSKHDTNILS